MSIQIFYKKRNCFLAAASVSKTLDLMHLNTSREPRIRCITQINIFTTHHLGPDSATAELPPPPHTHTHKQTNTHTPTHTAPLNKKAHLLDFLHSSWLLVNFSDKFILLKHCFTIQLFLLSVFSSSVCWGLLYMSCPQWQLSVFSGTLSHHH